MSRRDDVAAHWDDVVARFFKSEDPHRNDGELAEWFSGYAGAGRGTVTTEAFPEPYLGPLSTAAGQPRVVALGLNPGEADLRFQGRDGVFAGEIAERGFSQWAVTEPYLREPWAGAHRRNRYHEGLRTFARRWTGDPDVGSRDVLVMELFPWHSDKVTATMSPSPRLIDRFIWQPIAELDVPVVFAFGAPWRRVAGALGLPELDVASDFSTPARRLRVFALPGGQRLVVVWQAGYAGPPGAPDVALLTRALGAVAGAAKGLSTPAAQRAAPPLSPRAVVAGGQGYERFWGQLVDRLRRELPGVQIGAPRGNDLPMYSPLSHAKFKFNFPSEGLRLELLLTSTYRHENLAHLRLLRDHLDALQAAFGPEPRLVSEDLERRQRTQARLAVYLAGARVGQTARWTEFQDWFIDVLRRFHAALGAVPEVQGRW
ncbi:MAG: hypothetical protein QOE76_2260 [Frankiales bacterium]|jgi:hypothetical protein|nr:hypothetical protein [Frankiales bacterium]